MKLCGILSKVMDNYLCLRGIASIKALAEISEVNPDIQRNLLEEHKDEMKDFLERGEYTFFPEVVLSMDVGLTDSSNENFEDLLTVVDSADKGFNKEVGKVKINFTAERNKLFDERKQVKIAQFEFAEADIKLSRIDGNHRLSAAQYLANDVLIPFCLIVFPNLEEAKNNSRAIFHNINSKQIPLKLEQNIKIIIESQDVFPDNILKKTQPFGIHYKFTRDLLCGIGNLDFTCFPRIKELISEEKYSFFTYLFRYLLEKNLVDNTNAVGKLKSELVNIENALNEYNIITTASHSSIIGALAYYKLAFPDKYNRFIKWVASNHIAEAKTISLDDLINIFDKVYDNIPKKVFLARWYPATTDPEYNKAKLRLNAIKAITEELDLELIDIGTQQTGTFDIRTVMYHRITQSDIFIADLTGNRHNVMVEVGYALRHVKEGRMIFYFQPKDANDKVPFDLSGFKYEPISDSAEVRLKVKPLIEAILNQVSLGKV